jgi:alpha-ketoglutarate-dependent taurine dioxygenase
MTNCFTPLKPRVGAIATVSKNELLDPKFGEVCMQALERYGVLVFPDIGLTDEEQVTVARNMGDLVPQQGVGRAEGTRENIMKISLDPKANVTKSGVPVMDYMLASLVWHIDDTFAVKDGMTAPPTESAQILSARFIPAEGAQTEWCSTCSAFEDLPEADKKFLESLFVVHSAGAMLRSIKPDADQEERDRWIKPSVSKEFPLVSQMSSGRKGIVIGQTADYIVGMPRAESDALLKKLNAHATRPEYVYRHDWKPKDTLMWHNFGTLHQGIPYDPNSGRCMHRTSVFRTHPERLVIAA